MSNKWWYYARSLANHRRFLTWGALKRMVSGTVLTRMGKQRLRMVQACLTQRCNFSCFYCSSTSMLRRGVRELSVTEFKDFITQFRDLGGTHFDIAGGEPLLRYKDLVELIAFANAKRDMVVSVATNGWLITAEKMREMKEAGLTALLFNTQNIRPEVHDARVNRPGSWESNSVHMALAKKIGLTVCCNTCFGSDNWNDIKELMEWGDKHKIHVLLNLAQPTGMMAGEDFHRITEFKREYYDLMWSHPYTRTDTTYTYRGFDRCPGGTEKIYLTSYGDVQTCVFNQISFGNIRQDPLWLIHKRFLSHPLITMKSQCKQSFSEAYRKEWIDPAMEMINGRVR